MQTTLLGQDIVLRPLLNAAREDRLHHCYLFEGPPRVGKRTAAEWLAAAAACERAPGERPCGACPTCQQIRANTHPDVVRVEPDPERATRTISVAQVRELIRAVALRRYNARRRTIIIDPAESLVPQAANALLKTLEEPPPGTGFVLVTSQASSLLPTVRSRSQRVRFRAVAEAELIAWLEPRGVTDAVRIARRAQGSPGLALELAGGGLAELDALRDALLDAMAGPLPARMDYAEALTKGGRAKAAPRLEGAIEILEGLLRDVVLWSCDRPALILNADREEVVAAWSHALWPGGVERLRIELDQARQRMALNVNLRVLTESLISRFALELEAAKG